MQPLLLLFSVLLVRSSALLCNQCGGERYGDGLRILRAMCCKATVVECSAGLVCLRAVVVSPKKSFILSGCHVPEDGLIGCDFHSLPHNATIHRCICLDQSCQSYFPTGGNCTSSFSTATKSRPNSHHRKSHALSMTASAERLRASTTSTSTSLIASSLELANDDERHYAQSATGLQNSKAPSLPVLVSICSLSLPLVYALFRLS